MMGTVQAGMPMTVNGESPASYFLEPGFSLLGFGTLVACQGASPSKGALFVLLAGCG